MQKTIVQFRIYLTICALATLAGCSGYYKPSNVLTPPQEGHEQAQEKVSVRVKPLRDFECAHYFDNRLVARGIQPVQLYIQNDSDKAYRLPASSISFPLMGKREIGAIFYKNLVPRSIVWLFATIALSWKIFLPVFVVDLFFCSRANKNIKKDLSGIIINPKETIEVASKSRIHKVLFVPTDDYTYHFSFILEEVNSDNHLTFTF